MDGGCGDIPNTTWEFIFEMQAYSQFAKLKTSTVVYRFNEHFDLWKESNRTGLELNFKRCNAVAT
jgi:hypothetical protein